MGTPQSLPEHVDVTVPSVARIYDYLLGGAQNFAVDREFAERLIGAHPYARPMARLNRTFLREAVLLMIDSGIRQFLDLGSGIPTAGNVHEIAHEADADSHVVYVDYEEVAVAHTEMLLADNDRAAMVHADACDVDRVLDAPQTKRLLDFSQPVGLLAVTLFHYVPPDRNPFQVMQRYRDVLAPGSFLAMTHLSLDNATQDIAQLMQQTQNNVFPRTVDEIVELFGDFAYFEPGLVPIPSWLHAKNVDAEDNPEAGRLLAGVARKP
ncbi:SAM-dependent methyltransferase [Saccharopolyspora sp. K220]|uniref:SAM-dependent methyltransferase n=1 Tax=Saccharopolyspora soli TaxID=2926618 RepID=UPI001F575FAC|nr:SAM-dependent methyltransferase [Saccharopolyspora soli]MCI2417900.1 SAM-dependent methyltransferase [Saccharopolyspora soli]